ncbi:putative transcription factor bZIP family [Helianthus annuus]|nr:putative transcription factor bZIP family [Helianthus annuus]
MDSGILDADKISKGKSKWGEGNKVYTRRPKTTTTNAAAVASAVTAVAASVDGGGSGSSSPTPTAIVTATSPPTTTNNDQTLAAELLNSENRRALSPVVEVSDDHSVENRESCENGVVKLKPVVKVVDGRVRINRKAAKTKDEIMELRETLKTELERVRSLAQKVEEKEAELTAFSTVVGVTNSETYNHSQYLGDDVVDRRALVRINSEMGTEFMDRRALTRINSEAGSVTNSDGRPFRQLSVSVMNSNHGVGEFMEKEKRTPKANQYYRNSDFLLGKDRLPPETNKRRKSNSGRKHSKESDYVRNHTFRSCNNLLQRLMKHKFGWVFNVPVNAKQLGLHDYHDIIKHPMDLGTIKSRLAQNFYKSPMEFADDVRLTFRNAMTYNPKGQDVHVMAEQLSNIFEERWAVIESESNHVLRYGMIYDANTPTPTSRKVPHFAHAPSRMLYRSESLNLPVMTSHPQQPSKFVPAVRTPAPKKPKAKDPNKRNMTYEEKQKLSTNLQSLPSEKLDSIVQIIKKNTSLSQHDDEIEVDIDSVDIETLWELDRFVMNYRKNLSKHKRKAALAQQAREEAGDVNRDANPSTSIPEAPNENRTNEQTPLNQGGRGDNASSSSSSSSDSGSSSSDSDSDSSSEDGSDAGHSPRN